MFNPWKLTGKVNPEQILTSELVLTIQNERIKIVRTNKVNDNESALGKILSLCMNEIVPFYYTVL